MFTHQDKSTVLALEIVWDRSDYLKKFLPYLAQCSMAMSSTLTFFSPTGTSLFL